MSEDPGPLPSEEVLLAAARRFYDAIYAHPWLGPFFGGVDQARQEAKLVRFIQMAWDDPTFFTMHGRFLRDEHAHMLITDELFDLRHELFADALRQQGLAAREVEDLLRFNESWRPFVVKASIEECSDEGGRAILAVPRPT
ncbi:MAG: group 1 truncated hemoglobin [Myxococcales bacterium]|nr:group 1 truncated hemoglobin [Myxococcales bacterium]MCB9717732.1 group 1 truncated hemoglobin [Myxococcales bacterium]